MSNERGSMLYQTGRHELAEREFRAALGNDPSDSFAHAMLGLTLCRLKKYQDATNEVAEAIRLRPDWHFGHAAMADVMLNRERLNEAATAIATAIQLDPFNAGHHATQSAVFLSRKRWRDALASANKGLEIEPDHTGCLNNRAIALTKLGNPAAAGETIRGALHHDPENARTHANQGWALLHSNDHRQAMVHFREALRLDPNLAWAKSGLVESMKARNFVYRIMLRYFLLMSRLRGGAQWTIIIGGYVGFVVARGFADAHPAARPWLLPVIICYIAFALMTWLAAPLFNLMLRVDRFGRYALSKDETSAANCVGIALLCAVASLIAFAINRDGAWLLFALVFGLLLIPASSVFRCAPGWPRLAMAGLAVALTLFGITVGTLELLRNSPNAVSVDVREELLRTFVFGCCAASFAANGLMGVTVKR